MLAIVVFTLFAVACIVEIAYCEYYLSAPDEDNDSDWEWLKKLAHKPSDLPEYPREKISVIICAHNECENLKANLPHILRQEYHNELGVPLYEVIVVDDRSSDNTPLLLQDLSRTYSQLKTITISAEERRTFPGKKFALSKGVAASSHDILLMTDADCRPVSSFWIKWMTFPFTKSAGIVGGYGGYLQQKSFLNRFIECETIHTFAQFRGYCKRGKPYMAVGRNLACTKGLMLEAMRHSLWLATTSGDDDMLIRLCATPENMVVNDHPDSHTYSNAKSSWREYLHQKQRHTSTGKYYSPRIKRLLAGYAIAHAAFWPCLILFLIVSRVYWHTDDFIFWTLNLLPVFILGRILYFRYNLYETGKYLSGSARLKYFWYVFDFAWTLYNFLLAPYIIWKNKKTWR